MKKMKNVLLTLAVVTMSVVAMIGVAYLVKGPEGAEAARSLFQARLTLATSRMPVGNLSTSFIAFTVPKSGHVDVTAEISAGGEANLYVVSATDYANWRAGRRWSVQYGFFAEDRTGQVQLGSRLEAGTYYLLAKNENLFSDIRVDCTVVEDFKR